MKRAASEVVGTSINDEPINNDNNNNISEITNDGADTIQKNTNDTAQDSELKEHIYKKQELNDQSEVKKALNPDYTSAAVPHHDAASESQEQLQQQQAVATQIDDQTPTETIVPTSDQQLATSQHTDELVVSSTPVKPVEQSVLPPGSAPAAVPATATTPVATITITTAATTQAEKKSSSAVSAAAGQKEMSESEIETLKLKYLNERNLTKLIDLCQPLTEIYKEYQKLKYKNKIYSINDLVLIQNADDLHNDFIGQLVKIIRIENQGKYITLIQIKWFYKKDDLPKKFENIIDCISDNEIFETEHLDITFVDCINGPCRLYTYQEFDKLGSVSANTFFTRAKYDTVKKRLNPPFEKWEQGCICKRPLNPDYLYIQCEICEKWFHITCVNISEEEVETIESYKCPPCVSENQQLKPKMSIKGLQVVTDEREVVSNKRADSKKHAGKDNHSSK